MNMQEMPSVLRTEFSKTSRVIRPLRMAAKKAANAPMAELSTSEVQPLTKGTIMVAKMTSGSSPARSSFIFSARVMSPRSEAGRAGPSSGCRRQRT